MKIWKLSEDDDKFAMTPMIDVVFLLITFFMTVTSYASAELVQVGMPNAPEAKVPDDVGDRQFLTIAENGNYFLGAFRAELPDIKNALMARAAVPGFKGAYKSRRAYPLQVCKRLDESMRGSGRLQHSFRNIEGLSYGYKI